MPKRLLTVAVLFLVSAIPTRGEVGVSHAAGKKETPATKTVPGEERKQAFDAHETTIRCHFNDAYRDFTFGSLVIGATVNHGCEIGETFAEDLFFNLAPQTYERGYSFMTVNLPGQGLDYVAAESNSGMFSGKSNWRGPIWLPPNSRPTPLGEINCWSRSTSTEKTARGWAPVIGRVGRDSLPNKFGFSACWTPKHSWNAGGPPAFSIWKHRKGSEDGDRQLESCYTAKYSADDLAQAT